ncbi:hypothetical protein H7F50_13270 [Novosphingobium flavum]|uniref:Uncharacterized protein n=1 Tax=Novosphingobium aerophilum TaxID=2839843 RepID=A0A7X1F8R8_9SPHN|nr:MULTISPECIES: DUF6489 family protein [Novosphingobium]MBC2652466.1 hypothetical protein [Novosphingobium aerophilum]MBC2662725.1 hypothetical protein [Novosphingobium aerophilum]
MKVQVEVDCTPEEARRFLGLPDVSKANDAYVDAVAKAMQGVGNLDQLQQLSKQIAPMGELGLKLFQQFIDGSGMRGAKKD